MPIVPPLISMRCTLCFFTSSGKPIFQKNTHGFALAARVGIDPQCDDFELPIPTRWYLKESAPNVHPRTPNGNPNQPSFLELFLSGIRVQHC